MYRFILPALLLIGGTAALSADSKGWQARQDALDQAKLDKALAGRVAGKPQSCISQLHETYDTQRIGNTLLYQQGRGTIYRTDTGGGCFGLSRGDAIVTKSYSGQFCRGDIVQTVDLLTHTQSGSCSFGDFTPYTRP